MLRYVKHIRVFLMLMGTITDQKHNQLIVLFILGRNWRDKLD